MFPYSPNSCTECFIPPFLTVIASYHDEVLTLNAFITSCHVWNRQENCCYCIIFAGTKHMTLGNAIVMNAYRLPCLTSPHCYLPYLRITKSPLQKVFFDKTSIIPF